MKVVKTWPGCCCWHALVVVVVSVGTPAASKEIRELPTTPAGWIDRYEQSLERSSGRLFFRFVETAELHGDFNWRITTQRSVLRGTVFRDFDKSDVQTKLTSYRKETPDTPAYVSDRRSILTDVTWTFNDDSVRAGKPHANPFITIEKQPDPKSQLNRLSTGGLVLEGFVPGDNSQSLIEIFRGADKTKILPEPQEIDGHLTYVLEAEGAYGRHRVWLDPNAGFNPRRIEIVKTADDLEDGRRMGEPIAYGGSRSRWPTAAATLKKTVIDMEIGTQDAKYIATAAVYSMTKEYVNGQAINQRIEHRRFDWDFDPHWSALGAFEHNAPDGTRVFFFEDGQQADLPPYKWKEGKAILYVDPDEAVNIDELIKDVVASEGMNELGELSNTDSQAILPPSEEPSQRIQNRARLVVVVALIGACSLLLLYLWLKRKSRRRSLG